MSTDVQTFDMSHYYTLRREVEQVVDSAMYAIEDAMADGFNHGYRGNWKGQSYVVHVSHAFQHLETAMVMGLMGTDAHSDIEHALCRLAMALIQWRLN